MAQVKTIHEEVVECPFCKKRIEVKLKKETIEPGTRGEYSKYMVVEKSTQTTLKQMKKKKR